jgi:hypothetical protein
MSVTVSQSLIAHAGEILQVNIFGMPPVGPGCLRLRPAAVRFLPLARAVRPVRP